MNCQVLLEIINISFKIMDRFKLDVNDEEAVISLVKEIESSYDSIVGNITDRIHNYNTALK